MPRLARGPASSGSRRITASSPRSASGYRPAPSAVSACWYIWRDSAFTGGSVCAGFATGGSALTGVGTGADASSGTSVKAVQPAKEMEAITIASRAILLVQHIDYSLAFFHLGIAHRAQLDERGEAFLDPFVVETDARTPRVDLMQLDRLFLERIRLLFEHHVVLLQFVLGQFSRTLRIEQGFAEIVVYLCRPVGGRRRHFRHTVVRGHGVSLEHLLHSVFLELEIFLQGLGQADASIRLLQRFGHHEPAQRTEIARAVRALISAFLLGLDQLARPRLALRHTALFSVYFGKAIPCFDGGFERPRVQTHIALVRSRGIALVVRLLIQFSRLPKRLARERYVLPRRRKRLELASRLERLTAFEITNSEFSRYLGLQRMLRVVAAKNLEHVRGRVPILEPDQCCGGVVLRVCTRRRIRHHPSDAQKVIRCSAQLARRARLLALL